MSLRLLHLLFVRVCGWLVLPGRSSASKNAELLARRHEVTAQGIQALHFFTADLLNGAKVYVLAVLEPGT